MNNAVRVFKSCVSKDSSRNAGEGKDCQIDVSLIVDGMQSVIVCAGSAR